MEYNLTEEAAAILDYLDFSEETEFSSGEEAFFFYIKEVRNLFKEESEEWREFEINFQFIIENAIKIIYELDKILLIK